MARILLLETATEVCSVGLSKDGVLLTTRTAAEDYAHARVITLLIEECMQEVGWAYAQLSAIAVSSGPGSFTSLRVGTATAKGLCYALQIPLIRVDTLAALAEGVVAAQPDLPKTTLIFSAIDARRKEVYQTAFSPDLQVRSPLAAVILDTDSFSAERTDAERLLAAGNGAPKMVELLADPRLTDTGIRCHARHLAAPAQRAWQATDFVDVAYYEPQYLKSPNITTPKKKSLLP